MERIANQPRGTVVDIGEPRLSVGCRPTDGLASSQKRATKPGFSRPTEAGPSYRLPRTGLTPEHLKIKKSEDLQSHRNI
jgi:hypothetical protein